MISVSVITVSYNAASSIEKTILSVIEQRDCSLQYIIIDGGSSDDTQDIIRKYHDKVDIFISEPDKGVYDAMNKGLRYATGEYVIFMNSGDTFYNNTVIRDSLLIRGKGIIYGKAKFQYRNPDKEVIYSFKANKYTLTRKNICHQAIFYPRLCFEKGNCYNLKYEILSDWEFNLRMFKKYPFVFIDKVICNFSCDGMSCSNKRDEIFLSDFPLLIKQNLGEFPYLFFQLRTYIKGWLDKL